MENVTQEQKRKFIVNVAFFALLLALVWVTVKYVLVWLMPFVIALVIALLLRRPLNWILSHTRLPRKVVAPVITLVLVVLVVGLLVVLTVAGLRELAGFLGGLPDWFQRSMPEVTQAVNLRLELLFQALPEEWEAQLRQTAANLSDSVQSELISWSGTVVTWIAARAASLPSIVIGVIVTLVATFFMSAELEHIRDFVRRQIPQEYMGVARGAWASFGRTLGQILRSYLLIMSITFVELAIGLTILRVDYPVVLAAIISIVDILPVLGVGTVLLPWGVITLIVGDIPLGVGILLLYVIISVVRNFLEPRIVGKRIGLNPLITLLCLYVGLQLFGILGMFLVPMLFLMVKNAQDAGLIHLWKD